MSEPSMSDPRLMADSVKRTVGLATLSPKKGKYDERCLVIGDNSDAKRVVVTHLRQISLWGLLDPCKSLRDYAKGRYPAGINVHLIDQPPLMPWIPVFATSSPALLSAT